MAGPQRIAEVNRLGKTTPLRNLKPKGQSLSQEYVALRKTPLHMPNTLLYLGRDVFIILLIFLALVRRALNYHGNCLCATAEFHVMKSCTKQTLECINHVDWPLQITLGHLFCM